MKSFIKQLLNEGLNTKRIAYKVMRYENGFLISGANSNLTFPAKIGQIVVMSGQGVFISPNKQYVIDNYSGLADSELLITFEFDTNDIQFGNLTDREPEVGVSKAKIINLEKI